MARRRLRKILAFVIILFPIITICYHLSRSNKNRRLDANVSWFWSERPEIGIKSIVDPNLDNWPAWMLSTRAKVHDYVSSFFASQVNDDPDNIASFSVQDVDFIVHPFLLLVNATHLKLRWVLTKPIVLRVRAHATLPQNDEPWKTYPKTVKIPWDKFHAYEVDIIIPEHVFPTHLTYRVSFPTRFDYPSNSAERRIDNWIEDDVTDVVWERTTACLSGPKYESHCALVSIAVMGDNQFGATTFWQLMKQYRSKYPLRDETQYYIHLGDAIQGSDDHDALSRSIERTRQWRTDFFSVMYGGGFDSVPLIYSPGNHDIEDTEFAISPEAPHLTSKSYQRAIPHELDVHSTPYYAFTLSSVHFIVLNSNLRSGSGQDDFLQSQFESDAFRESTIRVIIIHTPPFIEFWSPTAWKAGESNWNAYAHSLHPKLVQHNITMVLSGHQHSYQRGEKDGVTYIISGGGGGTLDDLAKERVNDWGFYKVTESKHHFGQLKLYENIVMWEVFDVYSGETLDRIEIKANK